MSGDQATLPESVLPTPPNENANGGDDPSKPSVGDEDRARTVSSELHHTKTRRWTYVRVARQARAHCTRRRGQSAGYCLSHAEFRLLHALVECAHQDLSHSFPSVAYLVYHEGQSANMTSKLLRQLAEKGWLIMHRKSERTFYQFCIPEGAIAPHSKGWKGPIS